MNDKLWIISGGLLPRLAIRADGFDQAITEARATAQGYFTGVLAGTGRELFDHVLEANEDYVDSLNQGCDAETQEEALNLCRVLLDEVQRQGLLREYSEYAEHRAVVIAHNRYAMEI